MLSLSEVRTRCRETWGKDWYEVADDMKEARKCVAAAALGGPPADDASVKLAGDMTAARAATEIAAEQAAEQAKRQAERLVARAEAEALEEDEEAAQALINQQAWVDVLGKTWEARDANKGRRVEDDRAPARRSLRHVRGQWAKEKVHGEARVAGTRQLAAPLPRAGSTRAACWRSSDIGAESRS